MAEQENVRIIQEAYEAFKRGDIQALLNIFTDDVEWFVSGPSDIIPTAGRRQGRDQVAQFFATINDTEDIEQFEAHEFIAQGDKVVVLGHYRSRVKATGRTAESDWVHVHTLRDGKLVNFREYFDTAAVAEAYREASPQTATAP